MLIADFVLPQRGVDRIEPLNREQRDQGHESGQQKDTPEEQRRIQIFKGLVEIDEPKPGNDHTPEGEQHHREYRQIDPQGQAVTEQLPAFEIKNKSEGQHRYRHRCRKRQFQNLLKHDGDQARSDEGVNDIVYQMLGLPCVRFANGIEHKNQRQNKCQVERTMTPFLKDPETSRIDMEDG